MGLVYSISGGNFGIVFDADLIGLAVNGDLGHACLDLSDFNKIKLKRMLLISNG